MAAGQGARLKVMVVFGTRPEIIRMAAVMRRLDEAVDQRLGEDAPTARVGQVRVVVARDPRPGDLARQRH